MKIKLKPWDEVVELAKQHDKYDFNSNIEHVYGMSKKTLSWGDWVESRPADEIGDYFVENRWWVISWMVEDAEADDVLRYGDVVTDDQLYDRCDEVASNVRIRLIAYNGNLYYHKMCDGEIVDFRRVGTADV